MFMLKSTHERIVFQLRRELRLLEGRLQCEEGINRRLSSTIRELRGDDPVKMKAVPAKKVNPQTARAKQTTRSKSVAGDTYRKSDDTQDMLTPFVAAAVVSSVVSDSSSHSSHDYSSSGSDYSSGGGGDYGGGGGGSDF